MVGTPDSCTWSGITSSVCSWNHGSVTLAPVRVCAVRRAVASVMVVRDATLSVELKLPMRIEGAPPSKQVVLVGVGHTHAEIVRRWRARPVDGADLTCVSNAPAASYSGMLPGVLAGQYRPDDMRIDVSGLCAAAGAQLVVGEASRLDLGGQDAHRDGVPVPFDVLSIGIGSVPSTAGVEIEATRHTYRSSRCTSFVDRLGAMLRQATASHQSTFPRLGRRWGRRRRRGRADAAGLRERRCWVDGVPSEVMLVAGVNGLEPGRLASTTRRVQRALARSGHRGHQRAPGGPHRSAPPGPR